MPTQKPKKPEPKWVKLYDQALTIQTKTKGDLFDLVSLLAVVFDDKQFKRDMLKKGESPGDFLNQLVDHTFTTFMEYYAMLKSYPERLQWVNGDLREMRRTLIGALKARETNGLAGSRTTGVSAVGKSVENRDRRLSWKDKYLELEGRYNALEAKYQQLERDYNRLQRSLRNREVS
jgi:hypothetical protein